MQSAPPSEFSTHPVTPSSLHDPRYAVWSLFVLTPDGMSVHKLPPLDNVSIGRSASSHIRIEHPSISRNHAELNLEGGTFRIRDLKSRNGTTVGTHPIDDSFHEVRPGELIRIGKVSVFLERYSDTEWGATTNDEEQIVDAEILSSVVMGEWLAGRVDEIEKLASFFIKKTCENQKRAPLKLSSKALTRLRNYPWPGNIRELRNAIERGVLLCNGKSIGPEHLALGDDSEFGAASQKKPEATADLREVLREREHKHILEVLAKTGGNQTRAAKLLGISRITLAARIEEYRIQIWKK